MRAVLAVWTGCLMLLLTAAGDLMAAGAAVPGFAVSHGRAAAAATAPAPPGSEPAGQAPSLVPSLLWQAPSGRARFRHLSVEQGLSQSTVTAILQDPYGFIWIGTADGLDRYDGQTFVVYRHRPEDPTSLGANFVHALAVDAAGTLWIGTAGGGLSRFDRDTGKFFVYRHDPENLASLTNDAVRFVFEDSAGILWVSTDAGINRLDRQTGRFANFRDDPAAPEVLRTGWTRAICETAPGALWFGTEGGLIRYERNTGTFVHYRYNPRDPQSLGYDQIWEIFVDSRGRLWIGTEGGGISVLDPATGRFLRYPSDPDDPNTPSSSQIQAFHEDPSGAMWIGAFGGGLDLLDVQSGRFLHFSHLPDDPQGPGSNQVMTLYADRSGVLWIGTQGAGISLLDPRTMQFAHYRHIPGQSDSLRTNVVQSIYADSGGILWIGTEDGLDAIDRATGRFTHYPNDPTRPDGLSHRNIRAVHRDRAGTLWVGTAGGLDRLDPGSDRFERYRYSPTRPGTLGGLGVNAIYETPTGELWFGTTDGLDRFDRQRSEFVHYRGTPDDRESPRDNHVAVVSAAEAGGLWVASRDGLYRFDPRTGRWARYLDRPNITAVYQDPAGMVWLGTLGEGLIRLNPSDRNLTRYRERDGLPNDTINGLLADRSGRLWLSTHKGISRFDPQAATFRNYDARDGLQGNEFSRGAAHRSSDELFFGGIHGLTAFYPDQVIDNAHVPPVRLTALTQEGRAMASATAPENQQAITLRWPGNAFEFTFAVLDYVRPAKNGRAYRLDPFDQDWQDAGTAGPVRYTNLPGGTYTLRLKGSNNDDVWNAEGQSITVTVVPPFWQTWSFRGVTVLLLLGLVAGGYGLRLRNIQARNRTLALEIADRTLRIAQQNADLEALYQADAELDRHMQLDDVLQALVDIAVDDLKADKSAVLCLDDRRERLVVRVARNFSPQAMAQLSFAPNEGVTGRVVATGEPVLVEEAAWDPRQASERPEMVELLLAEGIGSFMHLPIRLDNQVFGVFNVSFARPRAFGERELRLFTALAQRAAIGVEAARHFDAEQRRAEQFRAISDVGRHIAAILDVDQLLTEIIADIQKAFGYEVISISLIDEDELVIQASGPQHWKEQGIAPLRVKVGGEGVIGWVAGAGEPLLVPDVTREPRYIAWPQGIQTRSELAVPLRTPSGVIGVLNAESERVDAFDESDLAVLQALANQAAVAIENARLYRQAQEMAASQERSRLARDLHDAVTQTLFSASLIAEALPVLWEANPSEGRQLLADLRQLTRGALAEMRSLLLELRPSALVEAPLRELLRQLAESVSGRTGIPVTMTAGGCALPDLPEDVHVALYRIAQEALNNVIKHAHASRVDVALRCRAAPAAPGADGDIDRTAGSEMPAAAGMTVELEICDDGRGFEPAATPADHLGLSIIRERAQAIGAVLMIESTPGRGTTVKVVWESPRDSA